MVGNFQPRTVGKASLYLETLSIIYTKVLAVISNWIITIWNYLGEGNHQGTMREAASAALPGLTTLLSNIMHIRAYRFVLGFMLTAALLLPATGRAANESSYSLAIVPTNRAFPSAW
jgi:hypothetical protein